MILEIDNVELSYNGKIILNGIYLKAETGKITSILGNNGSGKSSLLNIIFGTLKPKYKLIRIDKKPFLKPLYKSVEIKYLPQHNFIPYSLKLNMVFKLFNVDFKEFSSKFNLFSKYKYYSVKNLSSGEYRLVQTYLIIKSPSNIVLLDEPFNGIAPLYIEKVTALINKEKANKIIILTDHRYDEVIDISDSIYLIKNGCSKLVNNIKELEDYNYLPIGSLT